MFEGVFVPHVCVHVCHQNIHVTIIVLVKDADAHGTPGSCRKQVTTFADESLATLIFVVFVVALHVNDVKIRPAILVEIRSVGITTPISIDEIHLLRDIFELIVA